MRELVRKQQSLPKASKVELDEKVEIVMPTLKPHIDKKLKEELQNKAKEEKQLIINCLYISLYGPTKMRIWPTTYLFSKDGKRLSRLIKSFNIGIYPNWSHVPAEGAEFTLIFESLPSDIEVFDMIEVIPEFGEFTIYDIERNKQDVYYQVID